MENVEIKIKKNVNHYKIKSDILTSEYITIENVRAYLKNYNLPDQKELDIFSLELYHLNYLELSNFDQLYVFLLYIYQNNQSIKRKVHSYTKKKGLNVDKYILSNTEHCVFIFAAYIHDFITAAKNKEQAKKNNTMLPSNIDDTSKISMNRKLYEMLLN